MTLQIGHPRPDGALFQPPDRAAAGDGHTLRAPQSLLALPLRDCLATRARSVAPSTTATARLPSSLRRFRRSGRGAPTVAAGSLAADCSVVGVWPPGTCQDGPHRCWRRRRLFRALTRLSWMSHAARLPSKGALWPEDVLCKRRQDVHTYIREGDGPWSVCLRWRPGRLLRQVQ